MSSCRVSSPNLPRGYVVVLREWHGHSETTRSQEPQRKIIFKTLGGGGKSERCSDGECAHRRYKTKHSSTHQNGFDAVRRLSLLYVFPSGVTSH